MLWGCPLWTEAVRGEGWIPAHLVETNDLHICQTKARGAEKLKGTLLMPREGDRQGEWPVWGLGRLLGLTAVLSAS